MERDRRAEKVGRRVAIHEQLPLRTVVAVDHHQGILLSIDTVNVVGRRGECMDGVDCQRPVIDGAGLARVTGDAQRPDALGRLAVQSREVAARSGLPGQLDRGSVWAHQDNVQVGVVGVRDVQTHVEVGDGDVHVDRQRRFERPLSRDAEVVYGNGVQSPQFAHQRTGRPQGADEPDVVSHEAQPANVGRRSTFTYTQRRVDSQGDVRNQRHPDIARIQRAKVSLDLDPTGKKVCLERAVRIVRNDAETWAAQDDRVREVDEHEHVEVAVVVIQRSRADINAEDRRQCVGGRIRERVSSNGCE